MKTHIAVSSMVAVLIVSLCISTPAQIVFQDNFTGTTLDTGKWTIQVDTGNAISQNDMLISAKATADAAWENHQLVAVGAWDRASAGIGLVMQCNVKPQNMATFVGFIPEGAFSAWSQYTFAFHTSVVNLFTQDFGTNVQNILSPEAWTTLRLTCDPTSGGLYEFNTGSGWQTLLDTRGSGDTTARYSLVIDIYHYGDGTQQGAYPSVFNVDDLYVGYGTLDVTDWALY